MEENLALAKKLNKVAWGLTAVVLLLVGLMRRIHIDTDIDFTFLPPLYSALNALTAVVLLIGLYFIKQKNVAAHRKAMSLAILLSALFLLGYVVYHFTTPETKFCQEGNIRMVYFFLLITHIVLAALILPFIMFTYIRAFTGQIERHRKMARWVFPLWFYVAITGPILYMMLRPCYG